MDRWYRLLRNMGNNSNAPIKIIMCGSCRVAVFLNTVSMDGKEIEIPKVLLEVRYKDHNGKWRGTPGITLRELPKAILALQQAYEYLLTEGKRDPAQTLLFTDE
jgi:hypothetical protein